jgi:hypothetical protein
MVVEAEGVDAAGARRLARWSLAARHDSGPTVPVAAAAAVLRALVERRLALRGACACVGLFSLADIMRELAQLPISTQRRSAFLDEPALFVRALGDRFGALPAAVRRVHGSSAPAVLGGRGVARGSRWLSPLRALMRLPQPGRYARLEVRLNPGPHGERWTRTFGRTTFSTTLTPAEGGAFEERFGLLRFRFEPEVRAHGFVWRFAGWKLGAVPLPNALAPRIRARAFALDHEYRFRVAAAHPFLGLLFAYAGRLSPPP